MACKPWSATRREWAALLLAWAGVAQGAPPQWAGEIAAGAWSSNRMLDDRQGVAVGRLAANADWAPSSGLRVRADAWAMSAPARLDGQRTHAGIKELYVALPGWRCAPALGKRVVAWGKTDVINPTDQLSPLSLRRLVPKETEQRNGITGLHLDCPAGAGRVQAHLFDPRRFHEVPLRAQPGLQWQEQRPRARPALALKYDVLGEGIDWSVSAMEGIDLFPTLALRSAGADTLRVGQAATRMRMLGGDMAVTHDAVVYRAELAWVDHEQATDPTVARRRPWLAAVGQVEWGLGDRETFALQVFARHLRGANAASVNPVVDALQRAQGLIANEIDRNQAGLTFRYARPLLDSRADFELLGVWARPRNDWMVRARLTHALSDQLRLSAGADVFRGPADSFLGNLRQNSLAFVELAVTF